MTVWRLTAIIFILLCVAGAWAILGTSVNIRTAQGYDFLGERVEALWGTAQEQKAPTVCLAAGEGACQNGELSSSDIAVDLALQHRRKGLLWYATYGVVFDGTYRFSNTLAEPVTATVSFEFPSTSAIYDDFEFRVGDTLATPQGSSGSVVSTELLLAPAEEAEVHIHYSSRGMDEWRYSFAPDITTVHDFRLVADTDFGGFDFPDRTVSPSSKVRTGAGWQLTWQFSSLVSDFDVAVKMPNRINPGPLASRMSYFAPISLLFFFTVLVVLGAVRGINLHPMHYFFLGAAFFAFHLLFAYLVDQIALELAFVTAAVVSLALVITYLGRAVGWRFALLQAGVSQLLFLVLFSYAFFFEGFTGLVVSIGAIITLAVLMQVTAKLDWVQAFRRKDKTA
jgi:hypothetical protein